VEGTTLPWIHAARARRLALAGTIAAFAALTGTANAALTVQPNAPALTFPASVTDAVGGVSLSLCMDNSGNCIETPAPNPTQPLSVPGNFTPDGEGFYMLADATGSSSTQAIEEPAGAAGLMSKPVSGRPA